MHQFEYWLNNQTKNILHRIDFIKQRNLNVNEKLFSDSRQSSFQIIKLIC
jgi:hypothetical protein